MIAAVAAAERTSFELAQPACPAPGRHLPHAQVTRIHWEKNRFIYDLMYNRKVRWSHRAVLCRGGTMNVCASTWVEWRTWLDAQAAPSKLCQLGVGSLFASPAPACPHWLLPLPCLLRALQVMSRELYDWLVREKIADGALISKWRKPGYEILCSLLAIQKGETGGCCGAAVCACVLAAAAACAAA